MQALHSPSPSIYVLLGCPGAGKGTFAQTIKDLNYDHISTGDIVREELQHETPFGLKYKEAIMNHIPNGIPSHEIDDLVQTRLVEAVKRQKGVILDGYPKTLEQCLKIESFIKEKLPGGKLVTVLLDVKADDAISRIAFRQSCMRCKTVYNSLFSPCKVPNQCDSCGFEVGNRLDDDTEKTKKRVRDFPTQMQPIIDYYQSKGMLQTIDVNAPKEACTKRFLDLHLSYTSGSFVML